MQRLIGVGLVLTALVGCASHPASPPVAPPPAVPNPPAAKQPSTVRDVHVSRYTAVSTEPVPEQMQLTQQMVDIQIPARLNATVKDGLNYLLRRSGYTLCETPTPAIQQLFKLPLPAVHYHIGPTTLAQALQILAGMTYRVEIDEVSRSVCFALRPEFGKEEGKP